MKEDPLVESRRLILEKETDVKRLSIYIAHLNIQLAESKEKLRLAEHELQALRSDQNELLKGHKVTYW